MKKITVEYANDLEKKLFEMGHKFGNAEYRPAAKKISVRIIKNF